ncbi:MAG TPA: hypothetical protein VFY64_03700 [Nitrososphaeraceae archaeon]|nr:hypothetical protein [Nitrososphaeraceae archaeon]
MSFVYVYIWTAYDFVILSEPMLKRQDEIRYNINTISPAKNSEVISEEYSMTKSKQKENDIEVVLVVIIIINIE